MNKLRYYKTEADYNSDETKDSLSICYIEETNSLKIPELSEGVYIYCKLGKLVKPELFNNNLDSTIGVAIVYRNKFNKLDIVVLDKRNYVNSNYICGGYNSEFDSNLYLPDINDALSRFSGEEQSVYQLNNISDENSIFLASANVSNSEQTHGYIPSLGELSVINENKTEINKILELIEGDLLTDDIYWSSTCYDKFKQWVFDIENNKVYAIDKNAYFKFRVCVPSKYQK